MRRPPIRTFSPSFLKVNILCSISSFVYYFILINDLKNIKIKFKKKIMDTQAIPFIRYNGKFEINPDAR